jgi:3'-phosphoadenosine 5'-phosphosulfate sulfotransferase (PAPS reductase)/FAD synthetase
MKTIDTKKVQQAVRLIQSFAPKDGSPIEVSYSGGKDSDVILTLVRMSGVRFRAI